MRRIAKQVVYDAFEKMGALILEAGGPDGIVSRKDMRERLKTLRGLEYKFMSRFYRFMDHRDYKPGARITKRDVMDTIAYCKKELVDDYDLDNNGLSFEEVSKMSILAQYAVDYGLLMNLGVVDIPETQLPSIMRRLVAGLFFDAFGSEASLVMEVFEADVQLPSLNLETFPLASGLDQDNPAELVERYIDNPSPFHQEFIEMHSSFDPALGKKASQLIQLLETNLVDIRIFIIGRDDFTVYPKSEHPVYWVGLTASGKILGLRSEVIWT